MKKTVLFLMLSFTPLLPTNNHQRVLIICDSWNQIGGAESVLEQIKTRLKNINYEVFQLDFNEVDTFKVPFWPGIRSANPFGLKSKIAQKIARFKPDFILITFLGILSYQAGQYCAQNNIPFTVFYPSRIPEICKAHLHIPLCISYYFVKNLLSKASSVLVPTESLKRDLQQRGIKNVVVWPHGIDLEMFKLPTSKDKDLATKECNLDNRTRPFYLYVGRLSRAKNIQAFLDIEIPGTKILVGPEDYGYSLEVLKKTYPDVVFTGPKHGQELLYYYQCADLFVFPSKTDTFGLVLLESLASGVPIIAYNVTGPRDVAPTGCGVSYLARSDQELQGLALNAWSDKKAGKVTAQQCRNYAKQFSWDYAVTTLLKHATKSSLNIT